MLVIIGYNNTETEFLNRICDENNILYKYTLLEQQIIRAKKIILPHPLILDSTYRRMNIMNLFSLIRMVNKPILGINGGYKLMCNRFSEKPNLGLGFFDLDVWTGKNEKDINNYVFGKVAVQEGSILLDNSVADQCVELIPNNHGITNKYSKSNILFERNKYSLICEKNNYFGLELDLEKNEQLSKKIIRNFLEI